MPVSGIFRQLEKFYINAEIKMATFQTELRVLWISLYRRALYAGLNAIFFEGKGGGVRYLGYRPSSGDPFLRNARYASCAISSKAINFCKRSTSAVNK